MALTQVKTLGIADDAVTGAKIADDTVAEANMANDAIGLAELKAGTDGQVITYDASGNPTAVGPGTDGQVLTSTGAGSPPAFETLPTSGATLSGSTDNTVVTVTGSNAMQGETNVKIDSSSRMMVGGGTSINTWGSGTRIQAQGTDFAGSSISASRYSADASAPAVLLAKSRNGTIGTQTIVQDGDALGNVAFLASDGVDLNNDAVRIAAYIDGTPAENQVPGKLGVATTKANGQASWKLYIRADGDVEVVEGNIDMASGKGINFHPQGASDVNLLSDYEEGTWTPDLYHQGAENKSGFYTKIGRIVFAAFALQALNAAGNGNHQSIASLPFTVKNASPMGGCARGWQNYASDLGPLYEPSANGTQCYLYTQNGTNLTASTLGTTQLRGVIVYITDS